MESTSGIPTVKPNYPESSVFCCRWKPDTKMLELAKHAATKANNKHAEGSDEHIPIFFL